MLNWLSGHLVRLGPEVLFLVCLLETAVFAGMVLPVGALIAFSSMLATRGVFDTHEVALAALTGALVGDQLGFAVGRWFVRSAEPPRGEVARVWGAALSQAEGLLMSRRLVGISVGRAVPFVRTVMPWFAGRSGITWGRFAVFDGLGVLLWGAVYVGGGLLAGESWRKLSGQFGEVAGAIVIVAALGVLVVVMRRVTRKRLFSSRARH